MVRPTLSKRHKPTVSHPAKICDFYWYSTLVRTFENLWSDAWGPASRPMDWTWIEHWLNMDPTWIQHGFNMDSIWVHYGFTMGSLWVQHGFNMGSTWVRYGFSMDWTFNIDSLLIQVVSYSSMKQTQELSNQGARTKQRPNESDSFWSMLTTWSIW